MIMPSSPSNSLNHLLLPSDQGISTPLNVPTDTRNDTSCFTKSRLYALSMDLNVTPNNCFQSECLLILTPLLDAFTKDLQLLLPLVRDSGHLPKNPHTEEQLRELVSFTVLLVPKNR
jgi:hypothetical protein